VENTGGESGGDRDPERKRDKGKKGNKRKKGMLIGPRRSAVRTHYMVTAAISR
jgi:hypothetical protein